MSARHSAKAVSQAGPVGTASFASCLSCPSLSEEDRWKGSWMGPVRRTRAEAEADAAAHNAGLPVEGEQVPQKATHSVLTLECGHTLEIPVAQPHGWTVACGACGADRKVMRSVTR